MISKFDEYKQKALDRVDGLFKKLNIEYENGYGNIIRLKCPIHGSDSITNSIIYKSSGVWMCFSGNCHNDYNKTILGLLQGTLKTSGQPHTWEDLFKFIDGETNVCPIQQKEEKIQLFRDESTKPPTTIPSLYFLKKGYNPETLIKYEVGDCHKAPFDNRAIIPVRYLGGEYMGFTSRTHWPECKSCGYFHSKYTACISKDYDFHFMYKKYYHSKGLQKSKTLYGIDKVVGQSKIAIVEGPRCVWKLSEYGIPAVACLGKDFSKTRANLIQKLSIKNILFIPDNDEAGNEFKSRFIKDYNNIFNIFLPRLTSKDVDEMSDEDIKQFILRKWEQI